MNRGSLHRYPEVHNYDIFNKPLGKRHRQRLEKCDRLYLSCPCFSCFILNLDTVYTPETVATMHCIIHIVLHTCVIVVVHVTCTNGRKERVFLSIEKGPFFSAGVV